MSLSVAVYAQTHRSGSLPYVTELLELLAGKTPDILLNESVHREISTALPASVRTYRQDEKLSGKTELLISVGGDGTFLRAVRYVAGSGIPVIGINTGRMGFLATVHKEQMRQAVEELFRGKYQVSPRTLIEVEAEQTGEKFYALNEITVSRKNSTGMIRIDAYVNGEQLNRYWADGLILATPTGSTGYSLSCNGPIAAPDVPLFILTPIAPHSLNVRPLTIHDDSRVRLVIHSREQEFLLSIDSEVTSLKEGTAVNARKAPFRLNMIRLTGQSFIKTLKEKLLWGSDTRNY